LGEKNLDSYGKNCETSPNPCFSSIGASISIEQTDILVQQCLMEVELENKRSVRLERLVKISHTQHFFFFCMHIFNKRTLHIFQENLILKTRKNVRK